jgi:hypothetical protein
VKGKLFMCEPVDDDDEKGGIKYCRKSSVIAVVVCRAFRKRGPRKGAMYRISSA